MKLRIISLSAVLFLLSVVSAKSLNKSNPAKAENFSLKDYKGKEYTLGDFKNSKAVVIMFIATQCPVSNGYNTRMEQLYENYKDKGITFIGINSNKQESVDEIRSHAKEHNLNFIILKDPDNVVADKFGASVTPEIFVLNRNLDILYHGRIDDSRRESDVKSKDLQNTLDEILSGKKISTTTTKAFGCSIKRVS